jgi:hypothetical protein
MPFAHLYVQASQADVAGAIEAHLSGKGFRRLLMTPERHPTRMKEIREDRLRLFWVSPRLSGWTGIHEFRYYSNEARARWGMSDEHLALALSKALGTVWRIEAADNAGFWMYARYEGGEEREGKAYQDAPGSRTTDRSHPRYELNGIVERERFPNLGLGYEHIPGPQVSPIENVVMDPTGIEGLEGFAHLAMERDA